MFNKVVLGGSEFLACLNAAVFNDLEAPCKILLAADTFGPNITGSTNFGSGYMEAKFFHFSTAAGPNAAPMSNKKCVGNFLHVTLLRSVKR